MIEKFLYHIIGFMLPVALLMTTGIAFYFFGKYYGAKKGYFLGFLFYWLVWCLFVPLLLMTTQEMRSLFELNGSLFNESKILNTACLILPLVFAYAYAFPKALKTATPKIIIVSLALAMVNATLEELLWRGLYLKLFSSEAWLYVIVSSIGFAIWHFAPQLLFPNKAPGGRTSFVAFSFVLGILFGVVAYNTNSILLVTVCHIMFDFSGLGGRIYFEKSKRQ